MSFMTADQVKDRVDLVTVSKDKQDGDDVLEKLAAFDYADAHCYDPNEERGLLQVIEAVGGDQFNARIQMLVELVDGK